LCVWISRFGFVCQPARPRIPGQNPAALLADGQAKGRYAAKGCRAGALKKDDSPFSNQKWFKIE
jgi:hypothetical protein